MYQKNLSLFCTLTLFILIQYNVGLAQTATFECLDLTPTLVVDLPDHTDGFCFPTQSDDGVYLRDFRSGDIYFYDFQNESIALFTNVRIGRGKNETTTGASLHYSDGFLYLDDLNLNKIIRIDTKTMQFQETLQGKNSALFSDIHKGILYGAKPMVPEKIAFYVRLENNEFTSLNVSEYSNMKYETIFDPFLRQFRPATSDKYVVFANQYTSELFLFSTPNKSFLRSFVFNEEQTKWVEAKNVRGGIIKPPNQHSFIIKDISVNDQVAALLVYNGQEKKLSLGIVNLESNEVNITLCPIAETTSEVDITNSKLVLLDKTTNKLVISRLKR